MTTIQDTITNIRQAREKLKEAIREEQFATEPLLYDIDMLPSLYKLFCDTLGERAKTTNGRKVFTFIALYLYAPRKFFGGRMPKGLRPAIGRLTGIMDVTVSNCSNSTELLILYQNYTDFRSDVENVYKEIAKHIKIA